MAILLNLVKADYIGAFTLGLDIFLIIDTRIANFSDNLLEILF